MSEGAAEYLPPLVTKLKADITDLKKGFAEATKLQKKYKEDLDGLSTGFEKTTKKSKETGESVTDFERLVRSKMRSGETAVSAMRTEYERLNKVVKESRARLARGDTSDGGTYGE